ncbi:UrcA family protein [Ponticaulis sp.]|uniref:UrcA family protein n=1 Tax=Ponticaulis sp. TaxID=2020902 RepID=UPI000B73F19E|nr:UrcA family protein [Ponticaulis sp.]MAI89816.1 hypothetical protein [Ponticaulis sp.]OUX99492.1 MAG: hypothetical protein CBB65_05195 [Hyphomonadaceae bacterium TMED5]|tara:strand:- start:49999 stop:50313 length:315 start_codon:yes stop_codon:yes gene_type:complete
MKTAIIASSLFGLAIAPVSAAQDFAFEFEYDRSELRNIESVTALYFRLQAEIENACAINHGRHSLARLRFERQCISDTTENALQAINSSTLIALHEDRTGRKIG